MQAKKVRTDEARRIDENLQRFRLAARIAVARFLEIGEGEVLRRTQKDPNYIAPVTPEQAGDLIRETELALAADDMKALEAARESLL